MDVSHLPKTRFPVAPPWILIRDGLNLPVIDQPIQFIHDIRGTQEESLLRSVGDKSAEYKPEVRIGYVNEIGYSPEFKEFWITVRANRMWVQSLNGNAEHVHYWAPLAALPEDNYVESEYSFYEISRMVQADE